jgi:hypothetical protein
MRPDKDKIEKAVQDGFHPLNSEVYYPDRLTGGVFDRLGFVVSDDAGTEVYRSPSDLGFMDVERGIEEGRRAVEEAGHKLETDWNRASWLAQYRL